MQREVTAPGEGIEARIGALAGRIEVLGGWRRAACGLGAGAVSVLAMPPFFLWPVLIGTLPVLVWLIEGAATKPERRGGAGLDLDRRRLIAAGLSGWCFGYAFHVLGLYWLREAFLVTGGGLAMLWPLGVLGLPAFLAVFHGLAAAVAAALPCNRLGRVAALAVGLGLSEWLRGHLFTGFPWNVLGMALTDPPALMQWSGVVGIYGLTVVTVAVLATPLAMLSPGPAHSGQPPWLLRSTALAVLVVPLSVMLGYGTLRLSEPPPPAVEGARLRLVQPSIPQREKWMAEKQPEFVELQLRLSLHDASGRRDDLAGITHVIWPEAAMPFLPLQRPQVLDAIGAALPDGVHLLAGVLRMERREGEEARVYNSLVVLADDGRPIAVYDKSHLVPFGEYLPFQGLLEAIGLSALTRQRGGFAVGPEPRPLLAVPGLPGVGALICYEAVFPGISSKSRDRPHVLVNATNDGWFGNSTGPRQHLHQSRLRSVEEGLPLLRVANNGISAVYDAYGRELARLDMNVAGVIDTHLPGRTTPPLYARLGDLMLVLLCAMVLLFWYMYGRSHKP